MTEPATTVVAPIRSPASTHNTPWGHYALLLFGVFACSTSALFLKKCESAPIVVAGARLLIAAVALSPVMWINVRRSTDPDVLAPRRLAKAIPGAVVLSAHFILWAMGAKMTDAANATLVVNLNPIFLPFLMYFVNHERINRGEIIGTLIAMIGVIALMGQGYHANDGSFHGDVICFIAMILFCFYLAFGRSAGTGQNLWVYLVPLYGMSGIICLVAAVIVRAPMPVWSKQEMLMWLGLGFVPTIIGHSIFNHAVKHLRGQTIGIINLSQFVYSGVMAFFLFGEKPTYKLFLVAAVIAAGAVIVIRSSPLPATEPD